MYPCWQTSHSVHKARSYCGVNGKTPVSSQITENDTRLLLHLRGLMSSCDTCHFRVVSSSMLPFVRAMYGAFIILFGKKKLKKTGIIVDRVDKPHSQPLSMTRNSFFIRKLEFSIDNEHDYGHDDTQWTNHEVGNAQELILATHPGHVAEHHLLSPIKAQNRIVWRTKC